MTVNPAKVLSIDRGTLKPGSVADVTVIDPGAEWTIDVGNFKSKSRNCPFHGWKVRGRAHTVVVGGQMVAIAQRIPAHVLGDGTHTVRQLVEITNRDPRRGIGHRVVGEYAAGGCGLCGGGTAYAINLRRP